MVHCAILFCVTELVSIVAGSLSAMALLLIVALGVYCAKKHKTSKGTNPLCCVLNDVHCTLYSIMYSIMSHQCYGRTPEWNVTQTRV